MASIDLTKLQPGKTYNVSVRALDSDGNYSGYSVVYSFTTPTTTVDGLQLTSVNSAIVTALAQNSGSVVGGALTAGGLDTNGLKYAGKAQLADIWNGTASVISQLTGSANTGAVVINSTGILGYKFATSSSGQAQFFLNTADGNAYFRGTIFAGAGQIGGFTIGADTLTATGFVLNTTGRYLSLFDTVTPTTKVVNLDAYNGIWAGNSTSASAPFRVDLQGNLIATSASISGSISATSGSIGGWNIQSGQLYSNNVYLNSQYGYLQVGSATPNIVVMHQTQGLYAGSATSASAPFSVDLAGNLKATSASITGNINATSGSFSGNITAQSGTFTGAVEVQSGGSLYAGTNAGSGQRVLLNSTGLFGYDGNGIQMFSIPTATGASPTIARFQVLTTGIASEGSGSTNFIIGNSGSAASATANNITLNGEFGQMYSVINGVQTASSSGSGFYVDKAGNFRLAGASGTISMSNGNLSVTGNIVATSGSFTGRVTAQSGSIGGFIITSSSLHAGSTGSFVGIIPASLPFFAGASDNIGTSAKFSVTPAGALSATVASISGNIVATSGSFTGSIYATGGEIGGFSIPSASPTILRTNYNLAGASASRLVILSADNTTSITNSNAQDLLFLKYTGSPYDSGAGSWQDISQAEVGFASKEKYYISSMTVSGTYPNKSISINTSSTLDSFIYPGDIVKIFNLPLSASPLSGNFAVTAVASFSFGISTASNFTISGSNIPNLTNGFYPTASVSGGVVLNNDQAFFSAYKEIAGYPSGTTLGYVDVRVDAEGGFSYNTSDGLTMTLGSDILNNVGLNANVDVNPTLLTIQGNGGETQFGGRSWGEYTPYATSTGYDYAPNTSISSGSWTRRIVTFPTGRFTQKPVVTATWANGNSFAYNTIISIPESLVTSSSCEVRFYGINGAAVGAPGSNVATFAIHAIQKSDIAYTIGTMQ